MKSHLSLIMVGMLIGGLTSAFAQSGTLSAKDKQLLANEEKGWETAFNQKDAAGVAALYAEDGTAIVPAGIFQGRAALQKWIEGDLQAGGHDMSISVKDVHALGNAFWRFGDWSAHFGDQTFHGHWSDILVHVGDTLKIQQSTINLALPEPAPAPAK